MLSRKAVAGLSSFQFMAMVRRGYFKYTFKPTDFKFYGTKFGVGRN